MRHLPPPTYHLPPCTFHLPPPTFHLPPPTFHLPPPTSHLPPPTSHLPPPTCSCLVLLAHGSRNPNWREPFDSLLESLRKESGEDRVHLAHMQMAKPSLSDVVRSVAAKGTRTIRILPLLMAHGNHAQEDIPAEVEALRGECPGVTIEILPPIGSHPRFKTMMQELVGELL